MVLMQYYGTLSGALAYTATLPNGFAWTAEAVTDEQRTNALIRASRALDGIYGDRFPGVKAGGRTQVLAWPRSDAIDQCTDEPIPATEVPVEVENATYALALVELVNPGASSPTVTPGRVTKREKVDVLEREFFGSGDGNAPSVDDLRPINMMVEDALRCLLTKAGSGGSVCVLRY